MKLKSKMKDPRYLWILDHEQGLVSVAANTKSEARSLLKKRMNMELEPGSGKKPFMLPSLPKEIENA